MWHIKIGEKNNLVFLVLFFVLAGPVSIPTFCTGLLHRSFHFGKGRKKFLSFLCSKKEGIYFLWCLNLIISSSSSLRRTVFAVRKTSTQRFHCQLFGVTALSVSISVCDSKMRPLLDSNNSISSFFILQLFDILTKLFEKHTNVPISCPLQK